MVHNDGLVISENGEGGKGLVKTSLCIRPSSTKKGSVYKFKTIQRLLSVTKEGIESAIESKKKTDGKRGFGERN